MPAAKALFQMCGVFAEFERAMIQERASGPVWRGPERKEGAWAAAGILACRGQRAKPFGQKEKESTLLRGKPAWAGFFFVRPAGRTHLEVRVLYTPGMGKC